MTLELFGGSTKLDFIIGSEVVFGSQAFGYTCSSSKILHVVTSEYGLIICSVFRKSRTWKA